jgi:hypothetical protein
MKRYAAVAVLWFLMGANAYSQTGQWTNCIGIDNTNRLWNIANGGATQQLCFNLAHQCLGGNFKSATYYSSAVLIGAPYTLCNQQYFSARPPPAAPHPATTPPAQRPQMTLLIAKAENRISVDSGVDIPHPGDATYGNGYGLNVLLNAYHGNAGVPVPSTGYRYATWRFTNVRPGTYKVCIQYAADESRPLTLLINDEVSVPRSAANATGGWQIPFQRIECIGDVPVPQTEATVTLRTQEPGAAWPHVAQLTFYFQSQ